MVELTEFESDREFRVWHYSVSHAQLLLRSNRDRDHSTRVEVLFKGVNRMDIPTSLKGLNVAADEEQFILSGEDWSGRIEALFMYSIEDGGHYFDPSSLFIHGL